MIAKQLFVSVLTVLVSIFVVLSGCNAKGAAPEPTPTQSVSAPVTTTTTAPAPAKIMPGQAEKREITFGSSPTPAPKFSVATAWTKLTFTYWLNSTAACFVLAAEAPSGTSTGAAPELLFTSPSGQRVDFKDNLAQNTCNQNASGGLVKTEFKDATGEVGEWTVTVHGIGSNVKLTYVVRGT